MSADTGSDRRNSAAFGRGRCQLGRAPRIPSGGVRLTRDTCFSRLPYGPALMARPAAWAGGIARYSGSRPREGDTCLCPFPIAGVPQNLDDGRLHGPFHKRTATQAQSPGRLAQPLLADRLSLAVAAIPPEEFPVVGVVRSQLVTPPAGKNGGPGGGIFRDGVSAADAQKWRRSRIGGGSDPSSGHTKSTGRAARQRAGCVARDASAPVFWPWPLLRIRPPRASGPITAVFRS